MFATDASRVVSPELDWERGRGGLPLIPGFGLGVEDSDIIEAVTGLPLNVELLLASEDDHFVSFEHHT